MGRTAVRGQPGKTVNKTPVSKISGQNGRQVWIKQKAQKCGSLVGPVREQKTPS
jgi:hypothetical protein